MKQKETWSIKIMKHFYGIQGPLDEYRYQEINRIGNQAFMFLWAYLLIANMMAVFGALINPEVTLWIYIMVNSFVVIFGVSVYIIWQSKKSQVTEFELEEVNLPAIKKKMIRSTLIGSLLYGGLMFVYNALMATHFEQEHSFTDYLLSAHNIRVGLLQTFFFGLLMFLFQIIYFKKKQKVAEKREEIERD
ncbi:DUF3278 domain-containing protein [Vaginisenegalia massiliensis]|uniref:DUF3278 domain-containing protein n=1 Tax=Vaginisenegalia massiliensis TaxID=2058294 RepID=UPI000F528EB4|nr:DUF3278 domain-containing protein [Vaginisenegalia massiliensis]